MKNVKLKQNNTNHRKGAGFTLIELLVVVAIIGLIATIVLLNTQKSRVKAHDANIQAFMHQLRNAAEMNYDRTESYSQVCDESDDTLRNMGEFGLLEEAIQRENGGKDVTCFEGPGRKSFAASSPLRAKSNKCWCVESAGVSMELDCQEIDSAWCQCP